jgi:hypothetical protein
MRNGYGSLLLFVALLVGCGSDGGGSSATTAPEPQVQTINLGLVRSDAPTTISVPVRKPFYPAARVELAAPPLGPFAPAGGTLPMLVDGGETPTLFITFTPPATSPVAHAGTIELRFCRVSGTGPDCPVTLKLEAEIEEPSARLLQEQLPVGNAAVGETVKFGVYFENTSAATAVTLEEVTVPAGPFSLDPDGYRLPCPVAPGSRFYVKLLYSPQDVGVANAAIGFRHTASAQPLVATATGTGIAPRVEHDFGTVALDPVTFESPWLTFEVAPEATGILIEARGDPDALIDLIGFEGPDGTVYASYDLGGPLNWLGTYPAGARGHLFVELPNSGLPEVQLAGGGTYRFRLRDAAAVASGLEVRATVSQRRQAKAEVGTLDVRVFLAAGLAIDPADPMSDVKLAAVIRTIDAILGLHDVRLGGVTFSLLPPAYDVVAGTAAVEDLLATNTAGLPEGPLNLFLVKDMGIGVAGVAGAVPGPKANGTPYSGVVIDYGQWQGITVGANAAHQIAHYLGHMDEDGVETVILASGEAYPVLRHPLVGPGIPQDLVSPPGTTDYALINMLVASMAPMPTWCGTCTRVPLR